MKDYTKEYKVWQEKVTDSAVLKSLAEMDEEEICNAFSKNLEFGTGGLRGIMSAGTDRMNVYTVYRATEGLAKYMQSHSFNTCAVTYDSRLNSEAFGKIVAATLASNNITVYLTKECMPTPFLSFMVRHLRCDMGVNITASHNPSEYNGYKAYDSNGCQLTDSAAMEVTSYINAVELFKSPLPNFDFYLNDKIIYCDELVEQEYIANVLNESLGSADGLCAVYTPLNGVGHRIVPEVLKKAGLTELHIVPEQSMPDGHFATCPYPNPEKAEALTLAVQLAQKNNADIVLATDPDSDRLGVVVNTGKGFVQLNGNEVGVLLLDYVLSKLKETGKLPDNPVVVKTIVTSKMADVVAHKYGATVTNVLTGFKYIGDVINKLQKKGQEKRYVFGFEESCGYLKGTYVRDKDGIVAAMLVAECAAMCKKQGKTLYEHIQELYAQFGNYCLKTISYRFEGMKGFEIKNKLLTELRTHPFLTLGDSSVINTVDYLTQTKLDLPKSNVMQFNSEDGSQLIIRPSGTEPLIKCYITTTGDKAETKRRYNAIKAQTDKRFSID